MLRPKSESFRKWLGEGAKGLLDPASKRPPALVRNGVAPVQKRGWGGAKDSWETFAPWAQKSQKDQPLVETLAENRKWAEYCFGEYGFKHRAQ